MMLMRTLMTHVTWILSLLKLDNQIFKNKLIKKKAARINVDEIPFGPVGIYADFEFKRIRGKDIKKIGWR